MEQNPSSETHSRSAAQTIIITTELIAKSDYHIAKSLDLYLKIV
jgi:hypothetical protein